MKINWGIGITILYTGFVAMMLVLVSMSIGQKVDLVTEHYYEEELEFQGKIDKKQRTAALPEPLRWEAKAEGITIFFPDRFKDAALSGEIKFYCPSDEKNDRKLTISPKDHVQFIPTSGIPQGNYRLQIDWKNDNQSYWNEGTILISQPKQQTK